MLHNNSQLQSISMSKIKISSTIHLRSYTNIATNFKHATVYFPPFPILFRFTFYMVPDLQIQEHLLGIVTSCIRNPTTSVFIHVVSLSHTFG